LRTGADTEVLPTGRFLAPEDVSADGKTLLYSERSRSGTAELWTLPLLGGGAPSRVFDTSFHETSGRFSPDGLWLVYGSR
jgi:Tol biopolymer transport system component